MTYFPLVKTKVISSIPGRIRINIADLFKNSKLGSRLTHLLKNLKGIVSVSFNTNTGNILIFYNSKEINKNEILTKIESFEHKDISYNSPEYINKDSISSIILRTLNPLYIFKKKYPIQIYKNEYKLSKRILKAGILFGFTIFAFTFNFNSLISILLLSYPGILFTISSTAYYYFAKKANYNNFYLKNNADIKLLSKTNSLLIEDNLLLKKDYISKNVSFIDIDEIEMQKLVSLEKIENPIPLKTQKFVQNIREYGVTDFIIFSDKKIKLSKYLAYSLGIDKIYLLKDKTLVLDNMKNEENITTIISEKSLDKIKKINTDIIICVYSNYKNNFQKGNINFVDTNIEKFPWLLNFSRYNEEVIIQSQISAITFNLFVSFLAVIKRINPIFSLAMYGFNTLTQAIIIKNRIDK